MQRCGRWAEIGSAGFYFSCWNVNPDFGFLWCPTRVEGRLDGAVGHSVCGNRNSNKNGSRDVLGKRLISHKQGRGQLWRNETEKSVYRNSPMEINQKLIKLSLNSEEICSQYDSRKEINTFWTWKYSKIIQMPHEKYQSQKSNKCECYIWIETKSTIIGI